MLVIDFESAAGRPRKGADGIGEETVMPVRVGINGFGRVGPTTPDAMRDAAGHYRVPGVCLPLTEVGRIRIQNGR
jgi:hypothetical protein